MEDYQPQRKIVPGLQDESLVLVAVMPSPRDLEIARVLGWYRIPFKFAPKIVYVDFLAFYQTSSFGKERAHRIEVLAPVKGVELTTRKDLFRDEPDHLRANERYYKIQIGNLITISLPIYAEKWKRITFVYTTGKRIMSANTISDLVIKDDERKILWRSLRDRQEIFETGQQKALDEKEMDDILLMMIDDLQKMSDRDDLFIDY